MAPGALNSDISQAQDRPKLVTYLINLDRADARLLRMTEKLDAIGIEFERLSAIDGATLDLPIKEFSARSYKFLHGRRPYKPEIGCYLSHVECARRLLESDADFALILEDDLTFPNDFPDILSAAMANGKDWDLLRLSTVNDGLRLPFKSITETHTLAIPMMREKGAGAYMINRRAARWITRRLVPMRLAWDIAFDLEYLSLLSCAFVLPVPVQQSAEPESQIQAGVPGSKYPRWRYFTVLPFRAYLEITRLICRTGRLAYLKLKYIGKS